MHPRRMRPTGSLLAVAVLLGAAAAHGAAPRIHAITGARIVTAPGKVIESGTIVLRDGLVEAVGPKPATNVEQVWIDGTRPAMNDVQKEAFRKWSARPRP